MAAVIHDSAIIDCSASSSSWTADVSGLDFAVGDLFEFFEVTQGNVIPDTPSGWTHIQGDRGGSTSSGVTCNLERWVCDDAGVTSVTIPRYSGSGTVTCRVLALVWRGVDTSAPIAAPSTDSAHSDSAVGVTTLDAPSLAVTTDSWVPVQVIIINDGGSGETFSATPLSYDCHAQSGSGFTVLARYDDERDASTISAGTFTWDSSGRCVAMTHAVQSATATGVSCSGGVALPVMGLGASATQSQDCSGGVALPMLGLAAAAAQSQDCSGGVALPAAALAGAIAQSQDCPGGVALPALHVSAAAAQSQDCSGGVALPAVVLAGSQESAIATVGGVALPRLAAAGSITQSQDCSGGVALPALGLSGAIAQSQDCSGAVVLPTLSLSGAIAQALITSGGVTLPTSAAVGSIAQSQDCSGGVALSAMMLSGRQELTIDCVGAITLQAIRVAGAEVPVITWGPVSTRHSSSASVASGAIAGDAVSDRRTLAATVGG